MILFYQDEAQEIKFKKFNPRTTGICAGVTSDSHRVTNDSGTVFGGFKKPSGRPERVDAPSGQPVRPDGACGGSTGVRPTCTGLPAQADLTGRLDRVWLPLYFVDGCLYGVVLHSFVRRLRYLG